MKRLGLILPVLLTLPALSAADVVVPIDAVENNVNIRKSPEAGSDIVGRLDQGTWLTLAESVPGWHAVELPEGGTGFISSDWTRVLEEPPATAREARPQSAADSTVDTADDVDADPAPTADNDEVVADTSESATSDEAAAKLTGEEIADADDAVASESSSDDDEPEARTGLAAAGAEAPAGAAVETVGATPTGADAVVGIDSPEAPPVDEPQVPDVVEETVAEMRTAAADEVDARRQLQPVAAADPDETASAGREETPAIPAVSNRAASAHTEGSPPALSAGPTNVEGSVDFLMKFTAPTIGGNSQIFDDGNFVGIGTTEPKQRLEVNGNIQIHEQNSSVAGLLITQSGGETGYIMHNRASKLTIGAGSVDRITIDRDGNIGFGVNQPANPIELPSGAHVTRGGVWTNSSSRARKENIHDLSAEAALTTLQGLEPVQFNYRNDAEEQYVGFIAEDVPELVATSDREGLSAMDIVAVLTRVVQEQQKKIEALEAKLDQR